MEQQPVKIRERRNSPPDPHSVQMMEELYSLHGKNYDGKETNSASKLDRQKYLNSKIRYPDTMNMKKNQNLDLQDLKSMSKRRHNS